MASSYLVYLYVVERWVDDSGLGRWTWMRWETPEGKNQDSLRICADILPGGKEKFSISATPATSPTNQGLMQKTKGGLQERPGQIPDQMLTRGIITHPNDRN